MLGPASTDAVNRASRLSYGEATGITQTVRNYAASLGLAILGTSWSPSMRSQVDHVAGRSGRATGGRERDGRRSSPSPGAASGSVATIPHFIRLDFAYATRSVLQVMAGVMAAAAIVAFLGLRRGVQEETEPSQAEAPALA